MYMHIDDALTGCIYTDGILITNIFIKHIVLVFLVIKTYLKNILKNN